MTTPLFLTVDLEDQTEGYALDGRYVAMTYRLLNFFDERKAQATFFTVGRMLRSSPDLLREISERGHEIAFHSHEHIPLTDESPEIFRRETADDKDRLEQIIGKKVLGFRAPCYSLRPKTAWVADLLAELGFVYSSSVMPTRISRFGYAKAPRTPFLWKSGLVEFPLPVAGPGTFALPFSGGVYLYLCPFALTRKLMESFGPSDVVWTYMHPYDLDVEEKFKRIPNTPLWVRLLLSLAGQRAPRQIRAVLDLCGTMPTTLGVLAATPEYASRLPKFFG